MKLTDICVSLELAKQLKEAGYSQESLFSWYNSNYTGNKDLDSWSVHQSNKPCGGLKNVCAAPVSEEISAQLPEIIFIKNQAFRLVIDMDKNRRWFVNYVAYQTVQNKEGYCDLSVFKHDASIFGISTDNFGMTGLHLGATEVNLAKMLAHTWLYLKSNNLLLGNKQ